LSRLDLPRSRDDGDCPPSADHHRRSHHPIRATPHPATTNRVALADGVAEPVDTAAGPPPAA
jgi:hypothetical protein